MKYVEFCVALPTTLHACRLVDLTNFPIISYSAPPHTTPVVHFLTEELSCRFIAHVKGPDTHHVLLLHQFRAQPPQKYKAELIRRTPTSNH